MRTKKSNKLTRNISLPTLSKAKENERNKIANLVQDWVNKGNTIYKAKHGETGIYEKEYLSKRMRKRLMGQKYYDCSNIKNKALLGENKK